jgi:nitrite reductase/ring-hydroxylating ferredoxin subunit
MFRYLVISAALVAYDVAFSPYVSQVVALLATLKQAAAAYSYGFTSAAIVVGILVISSLLIDPLVVLTMFFKRRDKGHQRELEIGIFLNWIASGVFMTSLSHLLSGGGFKGIRSLMTNNDNNENRLALVLTFLSVAYLFGFFGVSLVIHDVSSTSQRARKSASSNLTAFVPPAYYIGAAALVWNLDRSLFVRVGVVAVTMIFFAALNLSHRIKSQALLDQQQASLPVSKGKSVPMSKSLQDEQSKEKSTGNENAQVPMHECEHGSNGVEDAKSDKQMFTRHEIDPKTISKEWRRQMAYDLFVYCLPLILAGFFLPFLKPAVHVVAFLFALFTPIYDAVTTWIFIQPSKKENPDIMAARKKTYPYGGAFVNGWFHLLNSDDLAVGQVKYVTANGLHYAVFRGEDNQVRAIDAHCIHLGANMAVGGTVKDNCLTCPFHSWSFDGEGKCTNIPYQPNVPVGLKTKAYHVCEYFGMILVWFHSQDKAPEYYPPEHDRLAKGHMTFRGSRVTELNMHLNEFAENSSDFQHFDPLHGKMTLPFTTIAISGK